jgi:hypothetical protein
VSVCATLRCAPIRNTLTGFSNIFKQPKYQQQAVADYIAAAQIAGTLPAAHFYNASGRAYPDAAAFSENFWIVCEFERERE